MGGTPPDPPPPDWDASAGVSAEFSNAQSWANSYGYNSTAQAIKDASGVDNFLYVGKSTTTGHVAWYLRPASASGNCAQAKIPPETFDVIKGGVLDTKSMKITYAGIVYLLDLRTDATGVLVAFAG